MKKLVKRDLWLKILEEQAPPHSGVRLYQRIHDELLIKAQEFTPEKAVEFKEAKELMGALVRAYSEYVKEEEYPGAEPRGPFSDMMGRWLDQKDGLDVRGGQFFTPMNVVDFMVKLAHPDDKQKLMEKPAMLLDPAAGTGRFMLRTAKHYADVAECFNFIFTNIDIDQRSFIYCTTNAILDGIPSINIHGDSLAFKYWEAIAVIPINGLPTWRSIDVKVLEEKHKKIFLEDRRLREQEAMKPRQIDTPFGAMIVKPKLEEPKAKKRRRGNENQSTLF